MAGLTVQEEFYSILIRFRFHTYIITAYIEKIENRNFQLILWRDNPSDELRFFRPNTVTYSTASALFLTIRDMIHLSDIYKETLPIGSKAVRSDFYVDDLLTGAESCDELILI